MKFKCLLVAFVVLAASACSNGDNGSAAGSGAAPNDLNGLELVQTIEPSFAIETNDPEATGLGEVALSPDGTLVAAAGTMDSLRVWNIESGEIVFETDVEQVVNLTWSPDQNMLAGASQNLWGTTHVWDVESGSQIATLEDVGTIRNSDDSVTGIVWTDRLAVGNSQTLKFWDTTTWQMVDTLDVEASDFLSRTTANGTKVATKNFLDATEIKVWDLATKSQIGSTYAPEGDVASDLAVSPNGERLLFDVGDGVQVVNVTSGETDQITESSDTDYYYGMRWSPVNSLVAMYAESIGSDKLDLVILDADTKQAVGSAALTGVEWDVALTPTWSADGQRLAATDHKGQILVFDLVS